MSGGGRVRLVTIDTNSPKAYVDEVVPAALVGFRSHMRAPEYDFDGAAPRSPYRSGCMEKPLGCVNVTWRRTAMSAQPLLVGLESGPAREGPSTPLTCGGAEDRDCCSRSGWLP
ncbi:hypothetical protein SGFS_078880 [Streptomyces graminofaciens]|uniref:Uncharacterized protein n=1 Tax=Streptomyces graminofaciens TaxID=68212 RepID=A0ABM7FK15_9ACTN|nr:hypothetical protein SGFS_078880 [Streptomyces graminofaciens]